VEVAMCENDAALTSSSLSASTTEATPSWQWYSDAVLTPIAGATSSTYNPGSKTPGVVDYYVRFSQKETSSGLACWSPATKVTRSVYQKPVPVFDTTLKSDYCYTQNIINLGGSDAGKQNGSNLFKVNGVVNSLITVASTKANQIDSVQYIRTTDHGCKDSITKVITIHYVAPPVSKPFNYKVIGVGVLPTITAEASPVTNRLQWYDASKKVLTGATGTILSGTIPEPTIDENRVYYVNQTDVNGCVSELSSDTIYYHLCPAKAPATVKNEMCTYSTIPAFKLVRGASATAHLYDYQVYRPYDPKSALGSGESAVATVSSATSSYDPTAQLTTPLTAGTYQFWVAEYDQTDHCLSDAVELLLTVKSTASPTAGYTRSICESTTGTVSLSVSGILSGSITKWYDSTATLAAEESTDKALFTGNPYIVSGVDNWKDGIYKYVVSTIVSGCQSAKIPVSFIILPKPDEPVVTPDSSCYGQPFGTLKATSQTNASINWYATTSLAPSLSKGPLYTPTTLTTTGVIPFYATQTSVEKCVSDPATVYYTLHPKPNTPQFATPTQSMCQSSTNVPLYTVTNASSLIKWIDQGTTASGSTYTPKLPVKGLTTTFKAVQTENGCVSDSGTATLIQIASPVAPTISSNNKTICVYAKPTAFQISSTGPYTLKWYSNSADIGSSNVLATGTSYLPLAYAKPQATGAAEAKTSYYVTQTTKGSNLCESAPLTVNLIVVAKPQTPVITTPTILVCSNTKTESEIDTLQATASTAGTFLWYNYTTKTEVTSSEASINSGFLTPKLSEIKALTTLRYYVKVQDQTGCISDSVVGTYKVSKSLDKDPILLGGTPSGYCLSKNNASKVYEVFAQGNKFEWMVNRVIQVGADSSQFVFKPTKTGDYEIILNQRYDFRDPALDTKTCKANQLRFTQSVKTVPVVSVIGDTMVCENTRRVAYAIKPEDPTHTFTWTVTGGRTSYSSSTNNNLIRQIDWITPGIDTIRVTEDNGICAGHDSLVVAVAPHAVPDFTWEIYPNKPQVLFSNVTENPVIIDGSTSKKVEFNDFLWNFGHEHDTIVVQSNQSFRDEDKMSSIYKYGYYNVTLVSVNNYCTDSVTKQIFVDMQEGLFVPNSFVPESNSPGLNRFQPKGFNLETYKIWIYDTWGNLMWYSDKLFNGAPQEGWDGTYNGVVAKMDCYIWKIEATFLDGTKWTGQASSNNDKKTTFGNVLLLR